MKAIVRAEDVNMGFQIAPMIDIVFVIMLFFMVMAGAIKTERQISTAMPGHLPEDGFIHEDDSLSITIDEDGIVAMNDEVMGEEHDSKLARLSSVLYQIRKGFVDRGSKVLVTIQADPMARYQRTIDVLNVLSKVGLKDVTFTVGSEDYDIPP